MDQYAGMLLWRKICDFLLVQDSRAKQPPVRELRRLHQKNMGGHILEGERMVKPKAHGRCRLSDELGPIWKAARESLLPESTKLISSYIC